MQRRLAQYLYDRWTVDYTTPPAGPVGSPKKTNDLNLLEVVDSPLHTFDDACALGQLYITLDEMGITPLGVSGTTRKRLPPVEKRTVRRLVETSEFIVPGARPVLPEGCGPRNSKLNELSDKDMLKLSYTWQMPAWDKVLSTEARISSASMCKKRFLEVTPSLQDLCIPEHFCY